MKIKKTRKYSNNFNISKIGLCKKVISLKYYYVKQHTHNTIWYLIIRRSTQRICMYKTLYTDRIHLSHKACHDSSFSLSQYNKCSLNQVSKSIYVYLHKTETTQQLWQLGMALHINEWKPLWQQSVWLIFDWQTDGYSFNISARA